MRFGASGSPDIVAVIHGRYVGIEVKAAKGKQSENQMQFQRELEAAGGIYLLVKSIEDIEIGLAPYLH
jgi:Holliday junction resolvase